MATNTFASLKSSLKKARAEIERLNGELDRLKSDEGLWQLIKSNDKVKDLIIGDYLVSLGNKSVTLLGASGRIALTPVNKPKNLADAKRLADKIIRS